MTDKSIEDLERKIAEANAKVAEIVADGSCKPGGRLDRALLERAAAIGALESARKSKLLSPEEADKIYMPAGRAIIHRVDQLAEVLRAAHERAYAVIEALPTTWDTADGRKHAPVADIKRALGLS